MFDLTPQLMAEFRHAPYGVVVIHPTKYKLLYANTYVMKMMQDIATTMLPLEEPDTIYCYQLFCLHDVCDHCPLEGGTGRYVHPKTGRAYLLTVKDITWECKPATMIELRPEFPDDPEKPESDPETTDKPAESPDQPSGENFYAPETQPGSPEDRIRQLERELQCTRCRMDDSIRALQNTQAKLENLINSVPGGIGLCRMIDNFPLFIYMSDGVSALSGRTPEEYREATRSDPLALVHPDDRERVLAAMRSALLTDQTLSVAYRVFHKNGSTTWIHLNGHRTADASEVYVVFSGMSSEARIFQTIARDMADAIYVIDRSNYDLLYISESAQLSGSHAHIPGRKCYQVLNGLNAPCEGCHHAVNPFSSKSFLSEFERNGRHYAADVCETDWNGIPAYVKYIRDITDIVDARREKDSLERYFQNILRNLPGGAAVIVRTPDGRYIPEYVSEGFSNMLNIPPDRLSEIFQNDATQFIHAPDFAAIAEKVFRHIDRRDEQFDLAFRLNRPETEPLWVSGKVSAAYQPDGNIRLYIAFSDISHEVHERERLSRQYNEMLLEHYRSPAPDALIIGHGNLTQKRMIEVIDRISGELTAYRSGTRDAFYDALSAYIVDPDERAAFRQSFDSENLTEAYRRGEAFHQFTLLMQFPGDRSGRFARIRVQFTAVPDTGDLVGILTVSDVTARTIQGNMQRRLADANCETLMDVDLVADRYAYHRFRGETIARPEMRDGYTASLHRFARNNVTPRDRALFTEKTDRDYIIHELRCGRPVSLAYTMVSHTGEIRVKRLTVFETDLRIGRVCISMTDITQSVQQQQGLLNIMAYTFELVGLIDLTAKTLTVHTRESILNYQPPLFFDSLENALNSYSDAFFDSARLMKEPFRMHTLLEMLEKHPKGYEFIVTGEGETPVYKQLNVLWGDENHSTICVVRADVTGMMMAERESRHHLQDALKLARAANDAKSEFLSQMSHDIRTPMNAIIGMTELALGRPDDPAQVQESLRTIRSSSDHLLHLINDILDMSRIESGRMQLSSEPFNHNAEMQAVVNRTQALAMGKNISFTHQINVSHSGCAGDALRIHQILDNLLGNAVKFTPEQGHVRLHVEELEPINKQVGLYRYIVEDDGVGIAEADIPRLFEPFYRTERARRNHVEGTGLGMSIVKNLIDFMGGAIRVESKVGSGTRVTLELPLKFSEAAAEPERTAAAEPPRYDLGGIHVLLVEDHPVNQLVAKRLLTNMNARVTVAADGKQGLDLFTASAESEFDVICMDLRMPVMDGYEAARAIRASAHPRAASIPIIAMTANAFTEDVQRCFEAGMTDHLPKPITPSDLFCKLSSAG